MANYRDFSSFFKRKLPSLSSDPCIALAFSLLGWVACWEGYSWARGRGVLVGLEFGLDFGCFWAGDEFDVEIGEDGVETVAVIFHGFE